MVEHRKTKKGESCAIRKIPSVVGIHAQTAESMHPAAAEVNGCKNRQQVQEFQTYTKSKIAKKEGRAVRMKNTMPVV
jgi:hypothetical protein